MFNTAADLADNLQVYAEFIDSRSAAGVPSKLDVSAWDLYFDTSKPVGMPLSMPEQAAFEHQPMISPVLTETAGSPGARLEMPAREVYTLGRISELPEEFEGGIAPVTYRSPVTGDLDLLGLVNDRLKTQARRYPHPITNQMNELGG